MEILIKRVRYPGSLDHVRAFMERILGEAEGTWTAPNGQRIEFYEVGRRTMTEERLFGEMQAEAGMVFPPRPATRGTWYLYLLKADGRRADKQGRIEAYEESADVTVLKFVDGYWYEDSTLTADSDPIGEAFEELADLITSEFVEEEAEPVGRGPTDETPTVGRGPTDEPPTVESRIEDVATMKQYLKTYSVQTAKEILEAIPIAHDKWSGKLEGQWGPDAIRFYGPLDTSAATISRYLGAFVRAGIKEVQGIPLPHRFRGQDHKKQ